MNKASVILLLYLTCSNIYGQTLSTSSPDSISFYDAVKKIESRYKLKFAFDHELFLDKYVQPPNVDEGIETILSEILDEEKFTYEFSGKTVLLIPRSEQVLFNVSLSGIVRDENTGEPLPNAAVYLKNSGTYALTNRDGKFNFLKIPTDTSQLEVHYLGYVVSKFRAKDLPKQKYAEINLINDPEVLQEVTISDRKDVVFEISNQSSKVSVDVDEFRSMVNYGEPDVFRSVQLLPGISATNETSSGLVIRGGAPEENLVLFDGFTVYQLDHFFGIFSAFNSNVIKDVQLYKGGYGARYGSRISGVMDITGKTGNTLKPNYHVGLNLISSSVVAEIPISKKLSFLAAGRRSYTDVVQSSLYKKLFNHVKANEPNTISQDGDNSIFLNPDFYFFDINSKLTYRFDDDNLLSFSFYNGRDNLLIDDRVEEAFEGEDFFRYKYESTEANRWGNKGFSARFARQWNQKFFTEANISSSSFFRNNSLQVSYEFEDTVSVESEEFRLNAENNVAETTIRLEGGYQINDMHSLTFGVFSVQNDIRYQNFYDNSLEGTDLGIDEKGVLSGAFSQYSFKFKGNTNINLGLRLTSFSRTNRGPYVEPRLSINHKVSPSWNLKFAYGKHHQFVVNTMIIDPTSSQPFFWQLANDTDIPVLRAKHYSGGLTFSKNGYVLDLEVYKRDIRGMTSFFFNPSDVGLAEGDLFDQGMGRASGLEFLLKRSVGNYNGWLAYTLSKSETQFDFINEGKYFSSDQDQRHEFKSVNMYSTGKWDFSATWIYGTGKPYSPLKQTTFTSTDNLETFVFADINLDSKNSLRVPAYHRMDVSVSYNTALGNTKCSLGVNFLNLYSRKNIRGYRFVTNFESSTSGTIERKAIKLLDFTPSIFLNFSF